MQTKAKNTTNKKPKPEITLMTLLACECPREATNLLLEHGYGKAKNHKDLERKLGDLYMKSDDKAAMERKLVAIHPHYNWFMRVAAPEVEAEKKKIIVEPDPPVESEPINTELIEKVKTLEQRLEANQASSNFFGVNQPNRTNEERANDKILIAGMVTIVAIFGMAIIANKTIKV